MTAEEFRKEAEQVQPNLISVAEHYLHRKEDAEDIVQDVLLKLWGMLEELHHPMDPLARVLTRNLCINHIRKHPDLLELDESREKNLYSFTESDAKQEMIERMMHSIEHLPPKQQLIIRLRHMDGMSTSEISQLTGDTEAAIRQTLCRARQGIKKFYIKQND